MRMSAPSSTRRAASFSPFIRRSGTCSIHGSYTTSTNALSVSQPSPRNGAVTNALCRSATPHPRAWLTQTSGSAHPTNFAAVPIHYDPRRRARRPHHDRPSRGPQRGRHGALQGAARGVGALRRRRPGVGRDHHRGGGGVLRGRRPQDLRARDHEAPEGDRREGPHRDRRVPPRRRHPRRCCATGRSTSR